MSGYFSPEVIRLNVMHSISPQLDRCDELLDYYLQDSPREVWGSIADEVNPDIGEVWFDIMPDLSPAIEAMNAIAREFWQNFTRDDVAESP